MKVFVTGASGWIGSALLPDLIAHGHTVTGLARSDASANKIESLGAKVIRGDLEELESLRKGASEADAVIHLGFIHDFSRFPEVCAVDGKAIDVMGEALAALDSKEKVFIGTGGALGAKLDAFGHADENALPEMSTPFGALRGANDVKVIALKDKGIRSVVMRLPPTCHGEGDVGFTPMLIATARKIGFAGYPGDGSTTWPATHRKDVATAYRLALTHAESGTRLHPIHESGVTQKSIAEAIGKHLDLPVKSVSDPNAHFGMLGFAVAHDCKLSSEITRETLGWEPKEVTLLVDLELGHYFKEVGENKYM